MAEEKIFYIEEYKSLKQEIATKLKSRLACSRWGVIAIAALYFCAFMYRDDTIVSLVPVFFSMTMIGYLNEEHRMVEKADRYIREAMEPWAAGGPSPGGWETFLKSAPTGPRWWRIQDRWPSDLWGWSPVPLWLVLFFISLAFAGAAYLGLFPPTQRIVCKG
jgi:hypothetical protein